MKQKSSCSSNSTPNSEQTSPRAMNSPQKTPCQSSCSLSQSPIASGNCSKSAVDAKRRRRMMEEGYYLPPELWIQVFARLPVKSLLKFRCVSKEWRGLIDCPDFASMHITHYKNNRENKNLLLIESPPWEEERWTVLAGDTFTKTILFLGKDAFDCSFARGYLNGLLLIIKQYGGYGDNEEITLWNPSVRKFMQLPLCPIFGEDNDKLDEMANVEYGLGFDSSSNDYKVVVIAYHFPEDDAETQVASLVQVYSLKSGCWKSITDGNPSLDCFGPQVFVDGAIHWLGSDGIIDDGVYTQIVSFDVRCEVFNYLNLPNSGDYHGPMVTYLSVLDDSLALLDVFPDNINVWVMENSRVSESWRRRYTINLQYVRFLYLKNNGELLFTRPHKGVESYNIKTQQLKDVDKTCPDQLRFIHTYVESLVLFNRVDAECVEFSGQKENQGVEGND
ncbi:hypothetical protein Ancab_000396 [Ancistrocladus abbreviatus]